MSNTEELQAQIHLLHAYLHELVSMLPAGPHYNEALAAVSRRFLDQEIVGLSTDAREKAIRRVGLP